MAERTFVIIKPDAVVRGLMGEIISRFERKSLKIVGLKMAKMKRKQLEDLYSHILGKPFTEEYFAFMKKTPVILGVVEGLNVIEVVRKMCGVTNCREAEPSTIRGIYGVGNRMNLIHASDSAATAEGEIGMFFKNSELYDYKTPMMPLIYSDEEIAEMVSKKAPAGRPRKIPGKEDE